MIALEIKSLVSQSLHMGIWADSICQHRIDVSRLDWSDSDSGQSLSRV